MDDTQKTKAQLIAEVTRLRQRVAELEDAGAAHKWWKIRSQRDVELCELFIDNIDEVFWLMDETLTFTFVSPSIQKLIGYTPEEFLALPIEHFIAPPYAAIVQQAIEKRKVNERNGCGDDLTKVWEVQYIHKNGDYVWVETTTQPVREEDGAFRGLIGIMRNVTMRKNAEQALQTSEARLSRAEIVAQIGNWEFDLATNKVYASEGARRVYGLGEAEWTISQVQTIPLPVYHPLLDAAFKALIDEGRPYDVVFKIRRPTDGQIRDIHSVAEYDPERKIVFGIIQDITEHKQTQEALSKYNILFESIIKQAPFAIHILEGSFNRMHVLIENDESRRIMGETVEGIENIDAERPEMLQCRFFTIDGKREIPLAAMPSPRAFKGEVVKNEEFLFRHPDGTEIMVQANASPVYDDNGEIMVVVVTFHDVTERERAEQALRESEERYRQLVELSPDLIAVHSGGKFIYMNQAGLDLLGVSSADQVIGQSVTKFVSPARRGVAQDRMRRLLAEGQRSPVYEQRIHRPDGTERDIEVVGLPFTHQGNIAVQIIAHDITDRKATEARLTQALAERTALMQELYHRTKNNMQVICAMLNIYAEQIADDRVTDVFMEMENRIRTMALAHKKLYESQNLSRINLSTYIQDLADLLKQSYRVPASRVSLTYQMEDVFTLIDTAVPCGLVFNELMSNALKHAFPGDRKGHIHIRLHRMQSNDIELVVADDGVGVPVDFDFRNCQTLGMQNIISVVEYQLQGEVAFTGGHGVRCQIRFRDNLYEERV